MEGQNGEQAAEQAIIGGGQDLLARLTGNLGIRAKLLLSFLVILALTVIVAIVALVGQRSAGRADEEMSQGQKRLARLSYEAQADMDRIRHMMACRGWLTLPYSKAQTHKAARRAAANNSSDCSRCPGLDGLP